MFVERAAKWQKDNAGNGRCSVINLNVNAVIYHQHPSICVKAGFDSTSSRTVNV